MGQPPIPYYPVNEFGPLMKGLVIGGVGILHVFIAQLKMSEQDSPAATHWPVAEHWAG